MIINQANSGGRHPILYFNLTIDSMSYRHYVAYASWGKKHLEYYADNMGAAARFMELSSNFGKAALVPAEAFHNAFDSKKDFHKIYTQGLANELENQLVGFFDDEDFSINNPPKTVEKVESVELLKCKCFYCEEALSPSQYYRFDKDKYEISATCGKCNRRDTVLLSDLQIKQCNAQGGYQMSMGK